MEEPENERAGSALSLQAGAGWHILEIMWATAYPAGHEVERAVVQQVTELRDPEQVPLIPRLDLGNNRVCSEACTREAFADPARRRTGKNIHNMLRELDRYLLAD